MADKEELDIEEFKNNVQNIRKALEPHQKPILYASIIFFIFIVGFFGFATGAYTTCNQVIGFLDNRFTCHLDYYPNGTIKVLPDQVNYSQIDLNVVGINGINL